MRRRWPSSWRGGRTLLDGLIDAVELRRAARRAKRSRRALRRGERGQPLRRRARPRPPAGRGTALRTRRAADRRAPRPDRRSPRAIATLPRRASSPSPSCPRTNSESARPDPGRRVDRPRPRPARRAGADPRQRPRPHLPVRCAARRAVATVASRCRPTDYFNRLASRVDGGARRPDRRRAALRRRHAASPARRQGHARGQRSTRSPLPAREAWTWEHMALCRARPLTGSDAARAKVAALIARSSARRATAAKVRADAAQMRDRHGAPQAARRAARHQARPGGLVDLEFAVHTLQLTTPCRPRSAARGGARGAGRGRPDRCRSRS